MNHKLIKYISALIIIVVVVTIALIYKPQIETKFVRALTAPNGTILGDIYVASLNDEVFTSLYISKNVNGEKVILYRIDKDGFFNTEGKDGSITKDKFYGYKFSSINKDKFTVYLLTDNGKGISDPIDVKWNYNQNIFQIDKPVFD